MPREKESVDATTGTTVGLDKFTPMPMPRARAAVMAAPQKNDLKLKVRPDSSELIITGLAIRSMLSCMR